LWGPPLCVGPLCGSPVRVPCAGPLCGSPLCGSPVWVPRRAASCCIYSRDAPRSFTRSRLKTAVVYWLTGVDRFGLTRRWYAPSPRHLQSLLMRGGGGGSCCGLCLGVFFWWGGGGGGGSSCGRLWCCSCRVVCCVVLVVCLCVCDLFLFPPSPLSADRSRSLRCYSPSSAHASHSTARPDQCTSQ